VYIFNIDKYEWNTLQSQEIDPHIKGELIFDMYAKDKFNEE
jgi:hypothetical protein